ncbi:hypothetical protein ScPMuIL_010377 [Solemya velum]
MRCLHMFLLLAVVVVCTFLLSAECSWTSKCRKEEKACILACFKFPCQKSCNRILDRCIENNEKQGIPTKECWENKVFCFMRCPMVNVCRERCEEEHDVCLTPYEPDPMNPGDLKIPGLPTIRRVNDGHR